MKKFFLMLLAVVGISVAAMADGTLTCTVYGSNGAQAELQSKGDCAGENGWITIPVKITNAKHYDSYVEVVVVVRDSRTGCIVREEKFRVPTKGIKRSGSEHYIARGYESGKCYTFSLSNAITCE